MGWSLTWQVYSLALIGHIMMMVGTGGEALLITADTVSRHDRFTIQDRTAFKTGKKGIGAAESMESCR
jgi:hypothetical protein